MWFSKVNICKCHRSMVTTVSFSFTRHALKNSSLVLVNYKFSEVCTLVSEETHPFVCHNASVLFFTFIDRSFIQNSVGDLVKTEQLSGSLSTRIEYIGIETYAHPKNSCGGVWSNAPGSRKRQNHNPPYWVSAPTGRSISPSPAPEIPACSLMSYCSSVHRTRESYRKVDLSQRDSVINTYAAVCKVACPRG